MRFFLFSAVSVLVLAFIAQQYLVGVPEASPISLVPISAEKKTSVVFFGDMMLGRFVETLSVRNNNFGYPFAFTSEIFSGADIVFGNFEGAVPDAHELSPIYSYRLSVHQEAVKAARAAGVNVVSVANNHTSDFGKEGFDATVRSLKNAGIVPVGEGMNHCTDISSTILCFFAWNDTFSPLDLEKISDEVAEVKTNDTFIVASVHFGNEYSATSSAWQRKAAHVLVDHGADVVIGHHPHVVEEMEIYNGKPIFYSLGNFVFDQYFSEETQTGLAVRAEIQNGAVSYELMPIDLHKSRPVKMPPLQKEAFLEKNKLHETFIIPR